jgi:ABC-type Fe3+-citrate transport system substrate-binding protein
MMDEERHRRICEALQKIAADIAARMQASVPRLKAELAASEARAKYLGMKLDEAADMGEV